MVDENTVYSDSAVSFEQVSKLLHKSVDRISGSIVKHRVISFSFARSGHVIGYLRPLKDTTKTDHRSYAREFWNIPDTESILLDSKCRRYRYLVIYGHRHTRPVTN